MSLLAQCLPEHDVNGPGSAADGLLSRGGTAARGAVGPCPMINGRTRPRGLQLAATMLCDKIASTMFAHYVVSLRVCRFVRCGG